MHTRFDDERKLLVRRGMRGQVELDSGTKDPSTAWFDGMWAASFRLKNVFDRVNKQPDESRKRGQIAE